MLDPIGTVADTSLGFDPSVVDFSGLSLSLAAGTRYWIGLSTSDGSSAYWVWEGDASGIGVAGQYFYNTITAPVANPSSDGPYQMQIGGTPAGTIPEPTSVVLLGLGLGAVGIIGRVRGRRAAA